MDEGAGLPGADICRIDTEVLDDSDLNALVSAMSGREASKLMRSRGSVGEMLRVFDEYRDTAGILRHTDDLLLSVLIENAGSSYNSAALLYVQPARFARLVEQRSKGMNPTTGRKWVNVDRAAFWVECLIDVCESFPDQPRQTHDLARAFPAAVVVAYFIREILPGHLRAWESPTAFSFGSFYQYDWDSEASALISLLKEADRMRVIIAELEDELGENLEIVQGYLDEDEFEYRRRDWSCYNEDIALILEAWITWGEEEIGRG